MMEAKIAQVKKVLAGWFATSFWVDVHYGLAALGTLVVFVLYIIDKRFDAGFAAFDAAMWVTAIGNDKVNLPPVKGDGS